MSCFFSFIICKYSCLVDIFHCYDYNNFNIDIKSCDFRLWQIVLGSMGTLLIFLLHSTNCTVSPLLYLSASRFCFVIYLLYHLNSFILIYSYLQNLLHKLIPESQLQKLLTYIYGWLFIIHNIFLIYFVDSWHLKVIAYRLFLNFFICGYKLVLWKFL